MSITDPSPVIRTPRLTLRAPRRADAARIAVLVNDFDLARMTTHVPHPYAPIEAEAFLDRMAAMDQARSAAFVLDTEAEGLVGAVGLHPAGRLGPEIGYWVGRSYWGQGLATEAARAVLDWARDDWGRKVVVSGHFEDNPASGRVLQKAGFLYTGEVQTRHSTARGQVVRTRMMIWLA